MKKVQCIGIVSSGCSLCEETLARLKKDFTRLGIELDVIEHLYEADPAAAAEIAEQFGLDDLPSFNIAGVVFRNNYGEKEVRKAYGLIR